MSGFESDKQLKKRIRDRGKKRKLTEQEKGHRANIKLMRFESRKQTSKAQLPFKDQETEQRGLDEY